MTSFRVIGPGWGYPLVFVALTVPTTITAASQPGGGARSLVIAAAVVLVLFGWWRRGVWFAGDDSIVVVNGVRRRVLPAKGTELELHMLGGGVWAGGRLDPRRVKTLVLVGPDGARVRIRVVDGSSGRRIEKAIDSLRAVLDIANATDDRS